MHSPHSYGVIPWTELMDRAGEVRLEARRRPRRKNRAPAGVVELDMAALEGGGGRLSKMQLGVLTYLFGDRGRHRAAEIAKNMRVSKTSVYAALKSLAAYTPPLVRFWQSRGGFDEDGKVWEITEAGVEYVDWNERRRWREIAGSPEDLAEAEEARFAQRAAARSRLRASPKKTKRSPRGMPGPGPLPRATCHVCGRDVAVRREGELREHRPGGPDAPVCPGSGKQARKPGKDKKYKSTKRTRPSVAAVAPAVPSIGKKRSSPEPKRRSPPPPPALRGDAYEEEGDTDFAFGALAPEAAKPALEAKRPLKLERIAGAEPITYQVRDLSPSEVEVEAFDRATGQKVGSLHLDMAASQRDDRRFSGLAGPYAAVEHVRVHHRYRRRGIGTRMYEWAAAEAASRGLPLASLDDRSRTDAAFWSKQARLKRAKLHRYRDPNEADSSRYALAYPPPESLNPPRAQNPLMFHGPSVTIAPFSPWGPISVDLLGVSWDFEGDGGKTKKKNPASGVAG